MKHLFSDTGHKEIKDIRSVRQGRLILVDLLVELGSPPGVLTVKPVHRGQTQAGYSSITEVKRQSLGLKEAEAAKEESTKKGSI